MSNPDRQTRIELPDDHPFRSERGVDRLRITVSTWGELKISRDGFRGAEYYTIEDGLDRIREFRAFGRLVWVFLTFCVEDSKLGYYIPEDAEIDNYRRLFKNIPVDQVIVEDVPNIEIAGGVSHVPRFYFHRDEGLAGLTPASKWDKEFVVPEELKYGFDSTVSNSMYQ